MSIDWKPLNREVLQKLDIKAEAEALGIVFSGSESNGWLTCHAIDREDNNPSAGVCVDSNHSMAGLYKDFGGDEKPLSLWDLAVKRGFSPEWREAQKHYYEKAGVSYPLSTNKNSRSPRVTLNKFMEMVEVVKDDSLKDQNFQLWADSKSPIEVQTIKDAGADLLRWPKRSHDQQLCIGFQAKNARGDTTGIILYRADGKDFPACKKGPGQRKTHMLRGSKDGWVIIGGKERFKNASVVWKVEGIPDALALHPHLPEDHVVVTNICGALSAGKCYPKLFNGKTVYAIGDADLPGQKGVKRFVEQVRAYASSVYILSLPFEISEKHGKDVRDFFNEEHQFQELLDQVSQLSPVTMEDVSNADGRVEIEITPNEKELNDQAIKAMAKHPGLFQRDGSLVHIVYEEIESDEKYYSGISPKISVVSEATLRELLTEVIYFYTQTELDTAVIQQQKSPTLHCVRAILNRGFWPGIRVLRNLVEFPVLRPDGTILDQPGYDEKTRLFYLPNCEYPSVPENPTKEEIDQARELILDIVCDFPFSKDEHKSAWVASLLTPLARWAFDDTAPLFLIDANVRGSGKSLLSDLVGIIVLGRPMSRMSNPRDDEEARKKITSLVMNGDDLVLIDNIVGSLGCSSLDQALTGKTWKDRKLGTNEIVDLPLSMTWYATGNNVVLKADTSRRVVHIRMNSPLEKPEEREGFKYPNIKKHVRKNREALAVAALTLLRGYFAAGQPDMKLTPWGSFDNWSDIVRSTVAWCGLPDPGNTREELTRQSDREAEALRGLIEGWEEIDPDRDGMTTNEIIRKLDSDPNKYELFRSSLYELCPPTSGKSLNVRSVGNKLRHLIERNIGGKALAKRDRHKTSVWFVVNLQADETAEGGSGGSRGCNTPQLYTEGQSNIQDLVNNPYERERELHPPEPLHPPLENEQPKEDQVDWTEEAFPFTASPSANGSSNGDPFDPDTWTEDGF
jgi:hypothetical protein